MLDPYRPIFSAASCRATRGICFLFALATLFCSQANGQNARPKIIGIDHVRLCVTDIGKAREFYATLYGVRPKEIPCYGNLQPCLTIGWQRNQKIVLEQAPAGETNFVAEIAFATDNVQQMRSYLASKGISVTKIKKDKFEKTLLDSHFEARDPEGHLISFIQIGAIPVDRASPGDPWYAQIIHSGFIVKDRAAENKFYQNTLGFRPYWHGGRKDDGVDDWVSFQVPDGTDWVEFMLNVPDNADKHLLGVMNHIALGVTDIQSTKAQLIKNGVTLTEEPKLGRDGKWQLNVYDPDETRIEFMEFTPKGKTCCSEFTAPHPKP